MPILGSLGGGAAKGFGFSGGKKNQIAFDYLVLAGGGSGGSQGYGAGGGGAGGYRTSFPGGTKITLETGINNITVGAGGARVDGTTGNNGDDSSVVGLDFTITSSGGGAGTGGEYSSTNPDNTRAPGGSGGGAGLNAAPFTPPVLPTGTGIGNKGGYSPPEGNPGGQPSRNTPTAHPGVPDGGGGGGAGSAGNPGIANPSPNGAGPGGPGGSGAPNTIYPSYPGGTTFGGGGGGDPWNLGSGQGGPGGGGNSGLDGQPTNGIDGLGGGGGGGLGTGPRYAGAGGDGVVILRAPSEFGPLITVSPGTNTKTTEPVSGDTICTFTVTGTLAIE